MRSPVHRLKRILAAGLATLNSLNTDSGIDRHHLDEFLNNYGSPDVEESDYMLRRIDTALRTFAMAADEDGGTTKGDARGVWVRGNGERWLAPALKDMASVGKKVRAHVRQFGRSPREDASATFSTAVNDIVGAREDFLVEALRGDPNRTWSRRFSVSYIAAEILFHIAVVYVLFVQRLFEKRRAHEVTELALDELPAIRGGIELAFARALQFYQEAEALLLQVKSEAEPGSEHEALHRDDAAIVAFDILELQLLGALLLNNRRMHLGGGWPPRLPEFFSDDKQTHSYLTKVEDIVFGCDSTDVLKLRRVALHALRNSHLSLFSVTVRRIAGVLNTESPEDPIYKPILGHQPLFKLVTPHLASLGSHVVRSDADFLASRRA